MNVRTGLAIALLLSAAFSATAEELRWKLKEGEEFVAKIEQRSEVTSTISGTSSLMTVETGMELLWKVDAVDEAGNATLTQRIRRPRMILEMPKAGPIVYDSAKADEAQGDVKSIAAAVDPLLEASVTLVLSSRGEISEVTLEKTIEEAVAKLSNAKSLQALLSKEGLTKVLQQSLIVLPEQEVKLGDTWSHVSELATSLGKMKHVTAYELLEPNPKEPQVALIQSSATLEPQGESLKTTLKSQQQKGTIRFDTTAGRLLSTLVEQELVTTTALKDTAIQVRLVSSLKTTLEEK